MKTDQFHILLILLSCIVAYFTPFELFLFSYVILGPLHYLTELTWLHEKHYFAVSSKIELIIIFLCAIVVSTNYICYHLGFDISLVLPFYDSKHAVHFILLAFGSAFSAIFLNNWKAKICLFTFCILGIYIFRNQYYYLLLVGLFLPTLIHVFVFTGIFMLVGIKKKPSFWAKLCFTTFMICAVSFFITPATSSVLSENIQSIYILSGFDMLNKTIMTFFEDITFNSQNTSLIFESSLSIKIQRFVAFTYTYHYLNWFSKVHIIAWHKVSKLRLSLAILFWIITLCIYFYDFRIGVLALYFLSMLHVLMEFPLNIQSVKILIQK